MIFPLTPSFATGLASVTEPRPGNLSARRGLKRLSAVDSYYHRLKTEHSSENTLVTPE